jgi:hypothetical protein
MVRIFVLGLVALLALAGAASACPFDKNAQTTTSDQQQTSDSSQLPLAAPGSTDTTKTTTETKTGG